MRKYLFFAELAYAYPVLRPLQREIWRRGDQVAWLLLPSCPDRLVEGEQRLHSLREAIDYEPMAVFAPGNFIYYFLPGVKVKVFHGYPINKRNYEVDNHFRLRGWFDMLCTQGDSSFIPFSQLSQSHPYFAVYKTGWARMDDVFPLATTPATERHRPHILYASTFTRRLTSAYMMPEVIGRMAREMPWDWTLTLHPKIDDAELLDRYARLAELHDNVSFMRAVTTGDMMNTDAMLCDSSSIIYEYMMMDKPVVTYRNSQPGPHLIDVTEPEQVAPALQRALTRPAELMEAIRKVAMHHEAFRDGHNCQRILDAVDDFMQNRQRLLAPKPRNLGRKLLQRWQSQYWWPASSQ